MDYGTKILDELINELEKSSTEEIKKIVVEADLHYNKILQKRGENIKVPQITKENYKELFLNNSVTDFSFKVAA